MAQAMARLLFPYSKGGQMRSRCFYEVFYFGDDVPEAVEGQVQVLEVFLVEDWGLSDLKTAVFTAIRDRATELDLTVPNGDAYIPTYEAG